MLKTAEGWLFAIFIFIVALAFWVVAYFVMPNKSSHRELTQNPPLTISAPTNSATPSS